MKSKNKKKTEKVKKPKKVEDEIPELIDEERIPEDLPDLLPLDQEEEKIPHFSDLPDPKVNFKSNKFDTYYRTEEEAIKEEKTNRKYTKSKYFSKPTRPEDQQREIDWILALGDCNNPYDYYRALKLDKSPFDPTKITSEEIKRSYFKICMNVHPDQNGDENAFHILSEAYQVLSDKDQKIMYDEEGIKIESRQVSFDEALKAFFNVDATMKYGYFVHKIIYYLTILYRSLTVLFILLLQVTKSVYHQEFKSAILSSISTGLLAYYFSNSIFYSGCLFCFKFSYSLASIFGFYLYFSRYTILSSIIKLKDQFIPIKPTITYTTIITFIYYVILRYEFTTSITYAIFIYGFRFFILFLFGTSIFLIRSIFDNTLFAASVLFILQRYISKYFEFGWIAYLSSLLLCLFYTAQVYVKRYDQDSDDE